jgi:hypothetical protein
VDKKRIGIALAASLAAAAAGGVALWRSGASEPLAQPRAAAPGQQHAAEPERLAQLPSRDAIGAARGQPFDPRSWAPPVRHATTVAAPPPKPVAPPVPYRVAGQVMHDGLNQVVLSRDDRVFTVSEGETLDNVYRIESIRPDAVTLTYLPLSERQVIPVGGLRLDMAPAVVGALVAQAAGPLVVHSVPEPSAAQGASADARPAQLRWEGPKQVQAGANFDVTLKLTTAQPVRALPMQLNYDAKLLEPVAVRPGDLFADGRFSYRVNPSGSIFVGASVDKAVPADAELMVVTFRPIRSGNAELRLSALALQGAAGRVIAHDPPAAFRTAIVQ